MSATCAHVGEWVRAPELCIVRCADCGVSVSDIQRYEADPKRWSWNEETRKQMRASFRVMRLYPQRKREHDFLGSWSDLRAIAFGRELLAEAAS